MLVRQITLNTHILLTVSKVVEKEHRELVELKNIARQVFTAIYMCKAELDEATEDNDWETVKRVRNVMAVCQKAVKGYSGGELWELEGMEEDK